MPAGIHRVLNVIIAHVFAASHLSAGRFGYLQKQSQTPACTSYRRCCRGCMRSQMMRSFLCGMTSGAAASAAVPADLWVPGAHQLLYSCNRALQLAVIELHQSTATSWFRLSGVADTSEMVQTLNPRLTPGSNALHAALLPAQEEGQRWSPAAPPHGLLPPGQRCTVCMSQSPCTLLPALGAKCRRQAS
jgi:hypothetical protein